MADKHQLLEKYWHYTAFRPCQEEIIDSVLQGRDTLALLPTGGGKSLCYQLPTLMMEGLCLVVSPLIALMKDQVQQLNNRRIKSLCLYAGLKQSDTTAVLNNAMAGAIKFLYVSPERLQQRMFIEHFRRMKVCLIAVDEAHCISQWGYDFRPPYLQIAEIRAYHPTVPVIALTATATQAVMNDIVGKLQMRSCQLFRTSFVRQNLAYSVDQSGDKLAKLLRLCGSNEDCGIVYCGSRRATESTASYLVAKGVPATFYHAGLTTQERDRRQLAWMTGEVRVMVATNAFGMGIDKPDVRFVAHLDTPDSIEAYFQEAGRAGRDGKPARAVLYCSKADIHRMDENLEISFPSVKNIRGTYNALCNYYRIPLGSGAESRFDFNLNEICSTYGFNAREFYSSCRFLEREGLVLLPDREDAYSKLFIPIGRDELYRFQVDHMRMGDLLQTVIRLYPGLFNGSEPIDERKIASRCMIDATEVKQMLSKMHGMHIVEYTPRPQKPQIIFCTSRVDAGSIYLGEQNYHLLKVSASQRLEAMKRYITCNDVCRSRQLVAYFGETETADCGQCDICRRRKQEGEGVEAAVLKTLAQGNLSVHALCQIMTEKGYLDAEEAVRHLLDRGEIHMDKNLFLSVV